MAVYKDEGIWRYRRKFTGPDGRKVRVSGTPAVNTKAAAEAAERAHVERVLNPPAPVVERMHMSDVFDRFLSDYTAIANNKPSEVDGKKRAIERYLRPSIGKLFADEVTHARIVELTAELRKRPRDARGRRAPGQVVDENATLGAKTIKNALQTLRKSLRWAEDMGWIPHAPKIQMPRIDETPIRFLEDAELDALIVVAGREPLWLAAVLLAADAGLRQGELRALKWTDINEVTGRVVLAGSRWRKTEGTTKSRKPRTIPLTARVLAALKAIRDTKLRGAYVFSRAKDGQPFGAEYMNETITRLTRNAKLTDTGWHTLRHTFCTRLAMRGVPAKTIQELAGHASILTTMRYMHVVKGAADAAIALLDPGSAVPTSGQPAAVTSKIDSEPGEIVPLILVTPKGLE